MKHRLEDNANAYRPTMATPQRSDCGVHTIHARTGTYTGYLGWVWAWSVPMDPHDKGRYVGRYDGTAEDLVQVVSAWREEQRDIAEWAADMAPRLDAVLADDILRQVTYAA